MALKLDVHKFDVRGVYIRIYSDQESFCLFICSEKHVQVDIHPNAELDVVFLKSGECTLENLAHIRNNSDKTTAVIVPDVRGGFEFRFWEPGRAGVLITSKGAVQYIHEPGGIRDELFDSITKSKMPCLSQEEGEQNELPPSSPD